MNIKLFCTEEQLNNIQESLSLFKSVYISAKGKNKENNCIILKACLKLKEILKIEKIYNGYNLITEVIIMSKNETVDVEDVKYELVED